MTAPAEVRTDAAPAAERRLSLYEITGELSALDELLEETEGEVTPEIEAWMEEFGPMLMRKVDSIGRYCANLTAAAEACKAEETRLAKRRKSQESKVASLKRLLEVAMQRLGESRLEGSTFAAVRQKNGGKRALEVLVPAGELPAGLTRTIPAQMVADDAALRMALDSSDGVQQQPDGSLVLFVDYIEGAIPVARLAAPTYSVRIK